MSLLSRVLPMGLMLTALCLAPALAATSEWATNEGGRMRMVVLPPDVEGKRVGALEIEPLPGWITYWREPGDSGIPPQLATDPGSPYTISPLRFPVPRRIEAGDVKDIGYDGPVTLPFTVEGPATASDEPLNATAFIGICRNICIPFQATFSLPLTPDAAKDAEASAVLARAAPSLPEAPSTDFTISDFEMSADLKSLKLTLTLPKTASAAPEMFVSGPSGYVFTEFEGQRMPDGHYVAVFPIDRLPKNYTISGQQWSLLAISGIRAMESPLVFE